MNISLLRTVPSMASGLIDVAATQQRQRVELSRNNRVR